MLNNYKKTYKILLNRSRLEVSVEKCAVLRHTHSLSSLLHDYTLEGHTIAIKKLHTYSVPYSVGIDDMVTHVQIISNKSTYRH